MAERYASALTGPEMDAALLDMAQHNSEAWAVGTRNGTAVSSSDDTYQNNSKYYANEAEAAAARAEAAVPAGTEGAVLFSQAQSLTAAQKQMAFDNIAPDSVEESLNLVNVLVKTRQTGICTLDELREFLQQNMNEMASYSVRFVGFAPGEAFSTFNQNTYTCMICRSGGRTNATCWFFRTSGGTKASYPRMQYMPCVSGNWGAPVAIVT